MIDAPIYFTTGETRTEQIKRNEAAFRADPHRCEHHWFRLVSPRTDQACGNLARAIGETPDGRQFFLCPDHVAEWPAPGRILDKQGNELARTL